MIIGTNHFTSHYAAVNYYRGYGYGAQTNQAVSNKIREGEIVIGKPPLKEGETLSIIDNCRYQIHEPE